MTGAGSLEGGGEGETGAAGGQGGGRAGGTERDAAVQPGAATVPSPEKTEEIVYFRHFNTQEIIIVAH